MFLCFFFCTWCLDSWVSRSWSTPRLEFQLRAFGVVTLRSRYLAPKIRKMWWHSINLHQFSVGIETYWNSYGSRNVSLQNSKLSKNWCFFLTTRLALIIFDLIFVGKKKPQVAFQAAMSSTGESSCSTAAGDAREVSRRCGYQPCNIVKTPTCCS